MTLPFFSTSSFERMPRRPAGVPHRTAFSRPWLANPSASFPLSWLFGKNNYWGGGGGGGQFWHRFFAAWRPALPATRPMMTNPGVRPASKGRMESLLKRFVVVGDVAHRLRSLQRPEASLFPFLGGRMKFETKVRGERKMNLPASRSPSARPAPIGDQTPRVFELDAAPFFAASSTGPTTCRHGANMPVGPQCLDSRICLGVVRSTDAKLLTGAVQAGIQMQTGDFSPPADCCQVRRCRHHMANVFELEFVKSGLLLERGEQQATVIHSGRNVGDRHLAARLPRAPARFSTTTAGPSSFRLQGLRSFPRAGEIGSAAVGKRQRSIVTDSGRRATVLGFWRLRYFFCGNSARQN